MQVSAPTRESQAMQTPYNPLQPLTTPYVANAKEDGACAPSSFNVNDLRVKARAAALLLR